MRMMMINMIKFPQQILWQFQFIRGQVWCFKVQHETLWDTFSLLQSPGICKFIYFWCSEVFKLRMYLTLALTIYLALMLTSDSFSLRWNSCARGWIRTFCVWSRGWNCRRGEKSGLCVFRWSKRHDQQARRSQRLIGGRVTLCQRQKSRDLNNHFQKFSGLVYWVVWRDISD